MRTRLVLMAVVVGAVLLAIRVGLDARAQAPFTHDNGPDVESPPRRSLAAQSAPKGPLTPRAAKTWAKLEKSIDFSFANETPIEEVLKYIKTQTAGPNDPGVPIYLDPIGLQEAEKTPTSPITLDLSDIPIRSGLELLLAQLGMRFFVRDDGIMVVSSTDYEETLVESGPEIAQALRDMKEEIAALRKNLNLVDPAKDLVKRSEIAAEIGELRNVILELRDARRTGP